MAVVFPFSKRILFVNYKPYLLCKASTGHVPIYQSHPRAMFHTMNRTCISEALWTLWKPLSLEHQLTINTEQGRVLAVLSSQRRRNLKTQPVTLQLGPLSTLILHENRAFRKCFQIKRNLKTPAFDFRVNGKHF